MTTTIHSCLIPEAQRMTHAAKLFGLHFPLQLEPTVFSFASHLSPDYQGGYWQFHSLSNAGFYMAPDLPESFNVISQNGYEGTMSADALGITVCLYAYSNLSFQRGEFGELCAQHYHLLREFAMEHAEVAAILRATD